MAKKTSKLSNVNKLMIEINSARKSLLNLRFQKSLQQLEHPQIIGQTKKEIAKVKTYMRQYQLKIK